MILTAALARWSLSAREPARRDMSISDMQTARDHLVLQNETRIRKGGLGGSTLRLP